MRIFAALELPQKVIKRITDWQKPLMSRYSSLKWVRGDRMHLTLRFFGDIPESGIENIYRILSSWHPGPLTFSLCSIGTFGKNSSPSVFWLGGHFPVEISEIAERLGQVPDEKGKNGGKKFVPHLTVARRKDSYELPEFDLPDKITGVFTEAAVINSRLTSGGPEYTFLERYDLH